MLEIIKNAVKKGQRSLSEYDSKKIIKMAGVPVTREDIAKSSDEAVKISNEIGYPVVLKGCSYNLAHKTEHGLVVTEIKNDDEVVKNFEALTSRGIELEGILIQEMVKGSREFVIGLIRDPQFGPCVMFGLGGIFTEALQDIVFRVAPLTDFDAEEMIDEIKTKRLLAEFRGSPSIDRSILVKALVGIGNLGIENDDISEIDINPLIISDGIPVAVDALVVLADRK